MHESSDRVFLDLPDLTSVTYGEADSLSAQLANRLTELALQPGDRVTAQVEKSVQCLILYLACLRAGFIFHPLNTAYTATELEHFFTDAEPALVVCSPSRFDETESLAKQHGINHVLTLDADGSGSLWSNISSYSREFPVAHQEPDDIALLVYTSGTTGKPKGAMITHKNIATNANALTQTWNWKQQDVLVHVLPLFHIHGLCISLHCAMTYASRVIFRSKFSLTETLSLIPQCSVFMAVPTIYTRLLTDQRLGPELCSKTRLFISGSAPLLPETFAEFEQRTGHRILERYGMTETAMMASNPLHGERIGGTVGTALPDINLRLCGENGETLEAGETGVLEVKGPNVFKGYWRNPEATSKCIRDDGYFVTGDLATIDHRGVVTIVGRLNDLIISAGFNIYPREIEIYLNQIPGIEESAVFGVFHSDLGEAVMAAIITRQQASVTEVAMRAALEGRISAFKIPKKFVVVEEFPRNAMGKVEKNRLRTFYDDTFRTG